MTIPTLTLASGYPIPSVAIGLWKVTDEIEFNTMFEAAVAAGYRHFDSAQAYNNEHLLGAALQRHTFTRDDIFITTKIDVRNFTHSKAKKSFAESLEKLQLEYVDLLLLHFPVPLLRKKAWLALEELQAAKKVKSIGVSNYTVKHLKELRQYAKVMPVINQVELHVYLQQPELLEYCRQQNIVVEAYSPLAHGKSPDNTVIQAIANKHHKTVAQIMLRWCLQQNTVVLPKSKTPSRLLENINIFDFLLDSEDMNQLSALDAGLRTCWDPTRIP